MEINKNVLVKLLLPVIAVILLIIISYFGYQKYLDAVKSKDAKKLNYIFQSEDKYTKGNCEFILKQNIEQVKKNIFINLATFSKFIKQCELKYDIENLVINEESCKKIIGGNKEDFRVKYIRLSKFSEKREECTLKFLTVTFSTGSLFNVENEFKSEINIDFGVDFYKDIDSVNENEFINHRTKEKQRLIELLRVTPEINITPEDIVLYKKRAILNLNLNPLSKYEFSFKSFNTNLGEETKKATFTVNTPEHKYFGIRIIDKVSLFRDSTPPKFELLEFDSGKKSAKIKICRIDNENYSKIEVFRESKGLIKEKKEFFSKGIDNLNTFDCKEKEVVINISENKDNIKLNKAFFDFDDLIGLPSRSGLYYVTFSDQEDRIFNNVVQNPIFFGIIDSHVTMKTSMNGEAFFFVNDFEGNPLANQKIRAYVNNFKGKEIKYNRSIRKNYETYFSPLNKDILSKEIILGITGNDGILKVDLKGKIDNAFTKTFESWNFDYNGDLNSFFITSASDTNLSYLSSKWNAGISPWNFGYSISSGWWYGANGNNGNKIKLTSWGRVEPTMYSHVYTDRKLYIPGEEVNIKSVIRNSKDLSIAFGKEVILKITDPKGKEVLNKNINISDFGSISEKFILTNKAILGNYNIYLNNLEERIGYASFSVEVFKNPKFKNGIMLSTEGLNETLVNIKDTEIIKHSYWEEKKYKGNFKINAKVFSKYYSGSPVKNANFKYKVYKQKYYDNAYWESCYYGCYGQPNKEFYTEGKGVLDENGYANINIDIKFESNYYDYKYIVEVIVTDNAGDIISGANSIIAKLANNYKRWNPNSGIYFETEKRFYEQGTDITINGGLTVGKFNQDYNNKFLLIIKKKDYITRQVDDIRGYSRPVTKIVEKLETILEVNEDNFILNKEGKLELKYKLKEVGEYIFEFGKINNKLFFSSKDLIDEFNKYKINEINKEFNGKVKDNYNSVNNLKLFCDGSEKKCSSDEIIKLMKCSKVYSRIHKGKITTRLGFNYDKCKGENNVEITQKQKIKVNDLIDKNNRDFFTVISYGDTNASNPIISDNKVTIISEKISYNIGETARILVRLPFSNGKILWTVEKQGVLKSELVDVKGNIFFKEFIVDDSFMPNAYIGAIVIDSDNNTIPEYKVGYTEVVVDKSNKKTNISIKTDKKEYSPREEVSININLSDKDGKAKKSELTVMVIDDSLISLMGNIDSNTLEKFYKKLPFQIQTSITNIAMLQNYYFSRKGIVGGSGFGNFKGGDSAVNSRNIFKNTAYYNASVITDNNGKANIKFNLPDNLTNFRIMVLSNSKDNYFGYSEEFIEVRKDVIIEDKTPIFLRDSDSIKIGANIFNTTDKKIGFKTIIEAEGLEIKEKEKNIIIPGGESIFVTWNAINKSENNEINYKITILGDSAKHSDKLEGTIKIKQSPILIQNNFITKVISLGEKKDLSLNLPKNTDISKSEYELYISTNPLLGIEQILSSLAKYPYGCIEQTISSTMPNAILKRFSNILKNIGVSDEVINTNLDAGIERIKSMQNADGGFAYWQGDSESRLDISPYVLRGLLEIKDAGGIVDDNIINAAVTYLEINYNKGLNSSKSTYVKSSDINKVEILWALSKFYKNGFTNEKLKALGINNLTDSINVSTNYGLIAHSYSLILADKIKYKDIIDNNIKKIIKNGFNNNKARYYNYSNNLQDKAIFAQLLMDYNYDESYISELIMELYNNDWSSYYYSTKSKNEVFMAFAKYIEKYGQSNSNKVILTLNGEFKSIILSNGKQSYKMNVDLEEVLKDDKVNLNIENLEGNSLFITSTIKAYPKNILKVKPYSNGVTFKREIYEVIDENDIKKKCSYSNSVYTCIEPKGLKLHTSDIFKKGTTYKIKLIANFNNNNLRNNLTIEDYLPASFRVLNSKFNTNSISTSQATTKNWRWNYVENQPGVIMTNAKTHWGRDAVYEYFIIPDFIGTFTYPPETVYMMYDPKIRANGTFRQIEVK